MINKDTDDVKDVPFAPLDFNEDGGSEPCWERDNYMEEWLEYVEMCNNSGKK